MTTEPPNNDEEAQRPPSADTLCAACLGSLGLFGNHLIQLAAASILAQKHGLQLQVPEGWRFRHYLRGPDAGWAVVPDAEAFSRRVLSDRVALSHGGLRTWIATREPYVSICRELGVKELSGKQLRRHFPQITHRDLAPVTEESSSSARAEDGSRGRAATLSRAAISGASLWGYFQFVSSTYAPYKQLIASLLRLQDEDRLSESLAAALSRGSQASQGQAAAPGRLIAVHIRRGDFATELAEPGPASSSNSQAQTPRRRPLRTEPPFEEGQGEAWDDPSGVAFRCPEPWLVACLEGDEVRYRPDLDVLWICSDDPGLSREPRIGPYPALSWAKVGAEEGRGAAAGPASPVDECPPFVADYFVLTRADVLLTSNSTFSYTAAWAATGRGPGQHGLEEGSEGTCLCLRPDPAAGGFVPFDPWNSLILLPSKAVPENHSIHRLREEGGGEMGREDGWEG